MRTNKKPSKTGKNQPINVTAFDLHQWKILLLFWLFILWLLEYIFVNTKQTAKGFLYINWEKKKKN